MAELSADLLREVNESFDAIDDQQRGFVTDRDMIYAMFLSLGVTFDSEEEFIAVLEPALVPNVAAATEEEEEKKGESDPTPLPKPEYKLIREAFITMIKEHVDKIDPVEGIFADVEDQCEVNEDGFVKVSELITFFEGANWLDASKDAIMEIVNRETTDESMIDYRVALYKIVQD